MPHRFSGTLFLLANVLCWGAIPVLLRQLTHSVDAWTANGVRYPLSALLYLPLLVVAASRGRLSMTTVKRCLLPALLAFGGQVCWGLAPYYLPASAIGFFVRMSLVWAVLVAMLVFQDERKLLAVPRFYLGMALLLLGFFSLMFSKFQYDAEVTLTGVAIILLCSLCFGLYGVSVRYFLSRTHPLIAFGLVSQFVSLGTLGAMFAWGNVADLKHIDLWTVGLLGVSSIIGVALGHTFFYASLTRLGAAITSGGQTATPFVTTLLAMVFLNERLKATEWIGGCIMIAGVAILLVTERRVVQEP